MKGVLYDIAAALPVFRRQGAGHFVNILSTAGIKLVPTMAVYAGSQNAVRAISEGLRREAGETIRLTTISPGFVDDRPGDAGADPGGERPDDHPARCDRAGNRVRDRTAA